MPLSHDHIRTTVETYLARHPQEREQLGGLLDALDRPTDIGSRSTFTGHVTCGAITRRPGTVPYRQAVPDSPYEALAARLDDGRVIVVTQPTGRPVPDLVSYAREVPASREQPGLPLRRP
ncbi:hypothetical protein [Streptomyces sp. NPDC054834]